MDGWMGLRPAGAMAVAVYAVKGTERRTWRAAALPMDDALMLPALPWLYALS